MLPRLSDTIAAVATPPGSGGVGVVRLSGPEALEIAARVWRGHDPRTSPGGRFWHGWVTDPESGDVVDEALLLVFRAPHSYTGQDAVEFQTHGSPAVLRRVLELLLAAGARAAGPGEFTLRAYLNGRMDLAQAESVLAVVEAESETARRQALRGLTRALSQKIEGMSRKLLDLLAHIQALLDYPEEGVEPHEAERVLREVIVEIDRLRATARAGQRVREGARLALVGAPNAGKSSLLNALLGYERALVHHEPGTTRDYLEAPLELEGVPLVAVDTAGVRATDDPVEAAGVARALEAARAADLILYLADRSAPRPEPPELPWKRTLKVATKADLPAAWRDPEAIEVSALTGAGLDALRRAIRERLLGTADEGEVWITHERHLEALNEARAHLEQALGAEDDLMGMSVEAALEALARITGETVDEAVVARIFQNFCVGK
ncbi:tRNA uridine-5-carboxymethylaminomethyl(34) synthesis GTPase MnmE [Oceanithermus sp.]